MNSAIKKSLHLNTTFRTCIIGCLRGMREGALKKRWGFFLSFQPAGGFPTVSITCLFNSYPVVQLFSSSVCGEDFWVGRFYSFFLKLEGNCFMILCWFLLIVRVNYMYTYVPSLLNLSPIPSSRPSPDPTPGCHGHWAELPVLYSSFRPAIYFAHGSIYMSMLLSQLEEKQKSS